MRERIKALVDFGQLNSGETRICVAATDIESGDPSYLQFKEATHRRRPPHRELRVSAEFAPLELDGRFLGDGGLSLNAPFDPILQSQTDGDLLLYIVDLYARDGNRPNTLEAASERKNDLLFGNQTYIRLNYCLELSRLRRKLNGGDDEPHEKVVLLSYRPGLEEPGPEKSFEMSAGALAQRWRAGVLDMEYSEKGRPNREVVFVRRA